MRRLGALLGVVVLLAWVPAVAGAAAGDRVDSLRIGYRVTPDGVLHVTETIVWRFGSPGRHGIVRDLQVREPYVDDHSKDQRYDVSHVKVSSPSGDSAEVSPQRLERDAGRTVIQRLRIGSASRTVAGPTATYVISYDVRGALRHFADHSELYWDATGNRWGAPLNNVAVTVDVPGGVTKVTCFVGARGSKNHCASAVVRSGRATFTQPVVAQGNELTIVAAIRPGRVRADRPIVLPAYQPPVEPTEEPVYTGPTDENGNPLYDEPDEMLPGSSRGAVAGAGALALLVPAAAVVRVRSTRRDERYAGLPPGAVPPDGTNVAIGKDTLREDQLPVAFAPPAVPAAEAGLLFDGKAGTEETAATLVDLAVRGAVRIEAGDGDPRVVLLDPAVAEHGHEQALLRGLFNPPTPGATRSLSRAKPGERAMYNAHTDTIRQVQHQVAERRWYTRPPTPAESSELSCLACMMVPVAAGIVGYIAAQLTRHVQDGVLVGIAGLVAGMSLVVLQAQRSRGRRSAAGRAVADQVVGFRTYLATAEADQLRFEEGEDIFGRYLPWAIVFGIADRWEAVCAELVAAGRLPAQTDWCVGETNTVLAFSSVMNDTLWSFAPPPMPSQASTSGSSSMFDSSSSFGGGGGSSSGFSSSSDSGGSSGGGGGGGGGDSW